MASWYLVMYAFVGALQGDPSGRLKAPFDLDLGCATVLPGIATVAAHQLPELLELSQQEFLTNQMGHPVDGQH